MSAAATTLHLVQTAGSGAFEACRRRCSAGDSVVFMDDGVRQLALGEPGKRLPPGVSIHYARVDLEARGLLGAAVTSRVRLLEDDGFTALLAAHPHCLSWK